MKLVLFNDFQLGVVQGDNVVDVSKALPKREYHHPNEKMQVVIDGWSTLKPTIEAAATKDKPIPISQVRLRAPLPKPGKIICIAVNYLEFNQRNAAEQDAFIKSSSAVIGNGDTVILPPAKATIFHHEAELAFVVGKQVTKFKAEGDWEPYIFGYTQFMDISARGFTPNGRQSFFWVKSFDTFAPMGPALVTADEVPDPHNLDIKLWDDSQPRQVFNTNDMAHQIPALLEFVSNITTLEPGDIVATGTNHQGIGAIQDGETLKMEIKGFGPALTVKVSDPLKRKWPKEIDKAVGAAVIAASPKKKA